MLEIERNEVRRRAFELQTELAACKAPLPRNVWRLIRGVSGRLLRTCGR